jgi:hypothetical protein
MKMKEENKNIKFYTTEDVQKYVNFINDNNLGDTLKLFETGFSTGKFFIDIEGDKETVNSIMTLTPIKIGRGKYKRTNETKLKQSKKMSE